MRESGIYCIENLVNGKKYIGQSVNIYDRWKKHVNALNNHCHDNDYLQKSWDKYGANNFKFYILEICDANKLNGREVYYIEKYDTLNRNKGYNIAAGGNQNGLSLEHRKRISDALIGHVLSEDTKRKVSEHHADVSGENNPMYGKHHSNEAKQKVSDANKGRPSWRKNKTPVHCIDLDVNFECAAEAGEKLKLHSNLILQCCYGNRKSTGGHQFEFINLENNIC